MPMIRRYNPVCLVPKPDDGKPKPRVAGARLYNQRLLEVPQRQIDVRRRVGEYRRTHPHVKKTMLGRLMGFDALLLTRLYDGTIMQDRTLDRIEQWLDNQVKLEGQGG